MLNKLKEVVDYCNDTYCHDCDIQEFCDINFDSHTPSDWVFPPYVMSFSKILPKLEVGLKAARKAWDDRMYIKYENGNLRVYLNDKDYHYAVYEKDLFAVDWFVLGGQR